MKSSSPWLLKAATSLKLTIACLVAAMVLVFVGTMAQVDMGLHEVQTRYFQSWLLWWHPFGPEGFRIPVFAGGHLIGAVMLANLILMQVFRFPRTWRAAGLHLIHAGILVILLGGLLTDLFSVESRMEIREGETKNYSEDLLRMELAVVDVTNPTAEQVIAIPEGRLKTGEVVGHPKLPFRIVVKQYFRNSRVAALGDGETPAANRGIGAQATVKEQPHATGLNERDMPSALIEIEQPDAPEEKSPSASLGTWMVSSWLGQPQTFALGGRKWTLALRPTRYYKPYSLTLKKFTHDRYPGTGIAKNFASDIRLRDPEHSVDRNVVIFMNNPLRYQGETFYQSGFGGNDTVTILQVVRNPSVFAPYIGCVIACVGMMFQFGIGLWRFSNRRAAESNA
jgi:hypothetical protein